MLAYTLENKINYIHYIPSLPHVDFFLHIGQLVVNLSVEERPLVAYQRRL